MHPSFANPRLIDFLVFHVHSIQEIFQYPRFSHLDEEQAKLMIQSAYDLAEQTLFPYFQEMDAHGLTYRPDGTIECHPQLKEFIQQAAAQGWIGASSNFEHGGLQVPELINNTAQHYFQAANNGVQGYIGLSAGAARLITNFGTQEQVNTFVTPIFEGKWQGTMALTEPQAGSSLSDITTKALPTSEGHYLIKGQKIFISAGQHDACDNFVHLTLARIEGAPAGTKGISLFIIPKYRVNKVNELEFNDVFCAGEYDKMGQRCYSTTHLIFGDQDDCHGYLVGEANHGLSYMFQMMNEARIGVGQTAASVALAAYLSSKKYALERTQGRIPGEKDPTKTPIPIYQHADVQRMLLTQKAIAEGALCLAMECNKLYDLSHVLEGDIAEDNLLLLGLLTPIIKTYASEAGTRATSLGVQVLGGYGYTMDFPLQQYYRDIKIMAIYEGTTGIQSMDLLGRKTIIQDGKALLVLLKTMQSTIQQATSHPDLEAYSKALTHAIQEWKKVHAYLIQFVQKGDLERYLADATIYMEMASTIVIAWQWLKMAVVAKEHLTSSEKFFPQDALESWIHTMKFFYKYELPHISSSVTTLMNPEVLTLGKSETLI
jgi:alkylation response protein AidB-like acyl-CoA dehydrogenase